MTTTLFLITAGIIVLAGICLVFRIIRRASFFIVTAVSILVCALGCAKLMQFAAMGAQQPVFPPTVVTTAVASEQTWIPTITVVGSLSAVQGVTLAAEMDGKVVKIAFESGAAVKAGDVLLQLNVASEEAQLRAAEAAANLAKISRDRSQELLTNRTVAQSEYDSSDAQYKQAVAQADNIRSIIEKKTVRAPFSGRTGIRMVNLGQIVKAGDAVVSLQALDPIYVDFFVPQQSVGQITSGLSVEVQTDALPGQTGTAKITAVNPDVDPVSRNVRVQATLANPTERLRPGMFTTVNVLLPSQQKVLVIPATAILYAPYGDSVFVVEAGKDPASGQPAKTIRQQFIRLGDKRGDFVAVMMGLKPGDEVVSTGAFKLRSGMPVVVNNALSPQFQLNPKPGDS